MRFTIKGWRKWMQMGSLVFIAALAGQEVQAQNPLASFSVNVSAGCSPLNVSFTNLSSQANSYYWNFGNGNTSTLPNPFMVYAGQGTYTVSLIAINTISNQRDTTTQIITVVPNPSGSFSATPLTSCAGSTAVVFTNTSSNASGYTWDFGDGNSSTATNPTHVYTTSGIYTIQLIASNAFGCTDIKISNSLLNIRANPVAAFTSNLSSTCNLSTVFNFTCTTPGVTAYFWNFGDGSTSTLSNPSHTYGAIGAYTITLVVTDASGCIDTLVSPNYINIGNALVPSFTVNSTSGCAPFSSVFDCTIPNATSWQWDFGDGGTSSLQNPTHIYGAPGVFTITLTVTTASGCNGTVVLTNYIQVDALPSASFTIPNDSGCVPYNVPFTNTSTGSATWIWDFGDGTNSTLQNPIHTYNTIGTYTVTLRAISTNGCQNVITKTNEVKVVKATCSFNASNNIGCPPLTVTFNSNATSPNIVSWLWTFGDGTTSNLQNPTHLYNTLGTYSVMLVVTNSLGCVDSMLRFNYVRIVSGVTSYTVPDTIKLCQPGVINCVDPTFGSNSWAWNFGDGGTSTIKNPTHTYLNPGTFIITLNNNMPGGCAQTFNPYAIVKVYPVLLKPIGVIAVSPCSPYIISFSNLTDSVSNFLWDFGDGTTSTLQNPTHTYANAGTYNVVLTFQMNCGCATTVTKTVVVGHQNPIAVNNTDFCLGDPSLFSITNPAAFVSYSWNFGDSTSSSQMNPSHTYATIGIFMVQVTTTDTSGCVKTYTYPNFININDPVPSFTVNGPTTGCSNLLVDFTNTTTNSVSYLWDFGDGSTSTATNPSHLYSNSGVYTVTLTATAYGCTKTAIHTNQVIINSAQCNFMYTYSSGCLPITVNFTDLSPNAISWSWNFGDGTTSSLQNPVHTFTTPPTGNITLTIADAIGCTKSRTKPKINYLNANFSVSDSLICKSNSVTFTDLSDPGVSWQWNFGDGVVSNLQNPTHTYTASGNYTVTLIVSFGQGCTDTVVIANCVKVSAPVAGFNSPSIAACSPSQISFNNLSTNASSYLWYFGDSTTSTIQSPSHIYSVPGYYNIKLVASDSTGCSDTLEKINYIYIPGTYAHFSMTSTTGCQLYNAQFTDSSLFASSWTWNFGDGSTSSLQNPSHIYTDTGSYIITLITFDTLGCSSFFSYPVPVVVNPTPQAVASSPDSIGCEPHTATFFNNSTNADFYYWSFGDGDTSSLANPTHTYLTPGQYVPYLVAYSINGCQDTLYLNPGIWVKAQPVASFTASSLTGCSPASISFANQSGNLSSPSYTWSFGNGNISNLASPSFPYTVPGTYQVTLVVINAGECIDSAKQAITIYDSPVANATVNTMSGCNPFAISLTNLSTNATSYIWDFGDGGTDTSMNPSYSYLISGVYNLMLVASNTQGCTDTFYLPAPVTVNESPVVNFSIDHQTGCPGSTFALTDLSTGTVPGSIYSWSIGSTISSSQQNPFITLQTPGLYDVTLVVDNQNGCQNSLTQSGYIQVYDSIPPTVCPIKVVSVLDKNRVEITWGVSTATDFFAYVLYWFDDLQQQFIPILVDTNQNNGGIVVTSDHIDTVLNTLNNVYTYKLETVDKCGNVYSGNKIIPHSTIDVSAQAIGKDVQVKWTPYVGASIDTYELSRQESPSGAWQTIASLTSNDTSYLDTTLRCPVWYTYRVRATNLGGEGYNSDSDTSAALPESDLADQEVEIVRSTVINNNSVLTEWLPPSKHPDRVVLYNIYRSTDSLNFTLIAAVPSQSQSYVDGNVDVMDQNYFYRVLAVNDCNQESNQFTNSSSILLKGIWLTGKTTLYWTQYRKWNSGINQYVIEKLDENGQWRVIKVVDGTINAASVDE